MKITTRTERGVLIADLTGRLDTKTSGPASEELARLVPEARGGLLVNMKDLEFLSSAGLRILLRTSKELKTNGDTLKVCQPIGVVKEVLDISGFASFLDIHDEEDAALAAFSSQ